MQWVQEWDSTDSKEETWSSTHDTKKLQEESNAQCTKITKLKVTK